MQVQENQKPAIDTKEKVANKMTEGRLKFFAKVVLANPALQAMNQDILAKVYEGAFYDGALVGLDEASAMVTRTVQENSNNVI